MSETWLYLMIKQTDCSRTFNEKPTWWIAGLMRKVATSVIADESLRNKKKNGISNNGAHHIEQSAGEKFVLKG